MPPAPKGRGRPAFSKRRDPEAKVSEFFRPRDDYPETPTPVTPSPYTAELAYIQNFRFLRACIRHGPHYAVIDPHSKLGQKQALGSGGSVSSVYKTSGGSFGAMKTFSEAQKQPERTVARLNERSYLKRLFPEELHPYVDPATQIKRRRTKKRGLSPLGLGELSDAEGGGKAAEGDQDEEQAVDEEQDNDYEDDEDDEDDNDYNAELYFDNGEDDDLGEDGGGDDFE